MTQGLVKWSFYMSAVGLTCMTLSWGMVLPALAAVIVVSSCVSNPHVANTLVRLEVLSVLAMAVLSLQGASSQASLFTLFVFFCVAVTDAVVGLSLFSQMVRLSGPELLLSEF